MFRGEDGKFLEVGRRGNRTLEGHWAQDTDITLLFCFVIYVVGHPLNIVCLFSYSHEQMVNCYDSLFASLTLLNEW